MPPRPPALDGAPWRRAGGRRRAVHRVRGALAIATRSEGESESAERRERRGGVELPPPAIYTREKEEGAPFYMRGPRWSHVGRCMVGG